MKKPITTINVPAKLEIFEDYAILTLYGDETMEKDTVVVELKRLLRPQGGPLRKSSIYSHEGSFFIEYSLSLGIPKAYIERKWGHIPDNKNEE